MDVVVWARKRGDEGLQTEESWLGQSPGESEAVKRARWIKKKRRLTK